MSTRPADVLRIALAIACMGWLVQASLVQAQTHPLNDTGITWSGNYPSGNETDCKASPAGQDCHHGRDAAALAGQLTKKGGGNAGFDFTKISNSGAELPENTALGSGPNDWACTKDNVTGLIWEVKTTSGLRSQNHTYTWFSTNSDTNGGANGATSGGICETTGRCDTEKFVADVNAMRLCGGQDWRMPTVRELLGIADMGRTSSPTMDPAYFPNTPTSEIWTGTVYPRRSDLAWYVRFNNDEEWQNDAANVGIRSAGGFHVQLVRAGH